MCAISGIIDFVNPVNDQELEKINDTMELRGPDDYGVFIDNHVGLGHRRLSIIDVESGHQPMSIENGEYTIVYNGETYNFQEIRDDLKKKGVVFATQSDTEVILWAYKLWGIEGCINHFDGMFAFAIYDKKVQKVYLVRDRFGEKPLYYQYENKKLMFASELKAFQPNAKKFQIDKTALNLFMSLSYIPAPYTIYQGIRKMKAGHYFEIDISKGYYKDCEYYDVVNEITEPIADLQGAKNTIQNLLEDSIKKRMVSDVPIGAFLSGGIDSSIVCCLMNKLSDKPINTFSIGYKEKDYDETERANLVVNHIKSNHTQYTLDYKDVLDILDDIILYYDEPYGDSSAIPSYYVAKLAKEKVQVVLTGDCADELFGGYEKYLAEYYVNKYKSYPKVLRGIFEYLIDKCPITPRTNSFLRKAKKVIRNSQESGFDLYYNMMCLGFSDVLRGKLLKEETYTDIKSIYKEMWDAIPSTYSYLQKEQLMDSKGVLEGDMFTKMDRACMHVSLENRAPFIDKRIYHFALNLDDNLKIRDNNKKYLLKEAFKDILPEETLTFRKSGFGVPVDYWFRNELKNELQSLLSKDFIEKQGLFNYDFISKMFDDHVNSRENYKFQLWNLFVFQKWYTKIYQA